MVKYLVFALLALSILAGCSGSSAFTEEDSGKTVELQPGDTLLVHLEGNLSTGYNWVMQPAEHPLLEQVGLPEYVRQGVLVGSGGVLEIKFKAIHSGEAPLKLVYIRPWEPDEPPLETYELNVVVK